MEKMENISGIVSYCSLWTSMHVLVTSAISQSFEIKL